MVVVGEGTVKTCQNWVLLHVGPGVESISEWTPNCLGSILLLANNILYKTLYSDIGAFAPPFLTII